MKRRPGYRDRKGASLQSERVPPDVLMVEIRCSRPQGQHWAIDLYLAGSLLLLSFIDIKKFLLLDVLTLPMIAIGLAVAIFGGGDWLQALLGAGLGYGLFAGLSWAWRRWRQAGQPGCA